MADKKRQLTRQEEFELMKLILDKFLWAGVAVMAFGFYRMVTLAEDFWIGFSLLVAGAILLILFSYVLVREYRITVK